MLPHKVCSMCDWHSFLGIFGTSTSYLGIVAFIHSREIASLVLIGLMHQAPPVSVLLQSWKLIINVEDITGECFTGDDPQLEEPFIVLQTHIVLHSVGHDKANHICQLSDLAYYWWTVWLYITMEEKNSYKNQFQKMKTKVVQCNKCYS